MKVLLAGDWHANTRHAINTIDYAASLDATEIWQCGDFGYWPTWETGREFLARVDNRLNEYGINLYFADGNHEHHPSLNNDAFRPYRPNYKNHTSRIWHVPRGGVLLPREGLRVMFIGGAASIDRKWRTPGYDWFSSETLTMYQIQRIMSKPKVDIVIAHDAPMEAQLTLMKGVWPEEDIRLSDAHRRLMSEFAKHLQPSLWVHGHYHQRMSSAFDYAVDHHLSMVCLAEDNMPLAKATLLLELEDGGWSTAVAEPPQ